MDEDTLSIIGDLYAEPQCPFQTTMLIQHLSGELGFGPLELKSRGYSELLLRRDKARRLAEYASPFDLYSMPAGI